jgi:rRNA maturation RNase YbeY
MPVRFFYADARLPRTDKRRLRRFVGEVLLPTEGRAAGAIQYVFCSDEYLLQMNRQYLQHDYYTDIITFGLSDPAAAIIDADIYISVDRVRDNALTAGVSFEEETLRVIFHGALHLCGYKDKRPADARQMRAKEDEYIRRYWRWKG